MSVPGATQATHTRDNLFASDFPRVTRSVVIADGETLVRGAVLGVVTANGQYRGSVSTETDGSQTPNAILADNVTTSGAVKTATVYETGHFNERQITLSAGGAHTIANIRAGLRGLGIHMSDSVPQ